MQCYKQSRLPRNCFTYRFYSSAARDFYMEEELEGDDLPAVVGTVP